MRHLEKPKSLESAAAAHRSPDLIRLISLRSDFRQLRWSLPDSDLLLLLRSLPTAQVEFKASFSSGLGSALDHLTPRSRVSGSRHSRAPLETSAQGHNKLRLRRWNRSRRRECFGDPPRGRKYICIMGYVGNAPFNVY